MTAQLELIGLDGKGTTCTHKRARRPSGKLYEPREVATAMEFILALVSERIADSEGASNKGLNNDFNHDKDIVANIIGSARYGDLPPDARSFVSRCASYKRQHPRKSFLTIAREQQRIVELQAQALWGSIIAIACEYEKRMLEEKELAERRRTLIMRMSALFEP